MESVILEIVDKIELELKEEPVIIEEPPQPVDGWICKYCSKVLKAKDKRRHYDTKKCLEERTRRGLL